MHCGLKHCGLKHCGLKQIVVQGLMNVLQGTIITCYSGLQANTAEMPCHPCLSTGRCLHSNAWYVP